MTPMRTTACCGECYSSFEDDLNPKNGCFVATILDTPLFDHTMLMMGGRVLARDDSWSTNPKVMLRNSGTYNRMIHCSTWQFCCGDEQVTN